MSAKVIPPPDRFAVRRTGEPDRLAPAIAVPAAPDTAPAPDHVPLPVEPAHVPERVPAGA